MIDDIRPWTGQVFMCGVCGAMYNNVHHDCPVCAIKDDIELGVAAATMQADAELGDDELPDSEAVSEEEK